MGGDVQIINTLFPSEQATEILPQGGIDIITSIAMFYDLESPTEFAAAVANLLSGDGIWVFEMSYLPLMLLQNSFDTICHEHLEYYSLAVLEEIMLGMMYDLPDMDNNGAEYVIDEIDVERPRRLMDIRVKRKESA